LQTRKKKRPSQAERYRRRRARYRRRRLVAVVVLGVLFFAIGTQAAALVQNDPVGQKNTGNGEVAKKKPPSVEQASFQTSSEVSKQPSPLSTDNTRATVKVEPKVKSRAPAASRDRKPQEQDKPTPQKEDKPAPEADQAKVKDESELPQNTSSDPLDVLVLGVDKSTGPEGDGSSRSDTMMLVRVTPATGEVKLLSVPRDLYVEIEPGTNDKINSAYAYGGVDQARSVMEGLTGVTVDNYVIVDYEGFREIIGVIGGVKVDVGHNVFPEKWHMGEGVERLGGRKALFYARYRGTPRADLDRIDHQQKLLAALRRQAFRWNTVTKMPAILKTTNENVETDLGIWQAVPLARALILHGREGDLTSSELQGYPTTLDDGTQVLVPEEDANTAILKDFRE
jgi:polyisoprenyl-teichoic acid--peptidoglycan teichoic acid transferase